MSLNSKVKKRFLMGELKALKFDHETYQIDNAKAMDRVWAKLAQITLREKEQ